MKPKLPATSPTGWWLAGLLEKQLSPERTPYWNNYRLVRAEDWRTAFRKAMEMGLSDQETGNRLFPGRSEFVGLSQLVPIYDEFSDGAEILWEEIQPDEAGGDPPLRIFTEADLAGIYEPPSEAGN